MRKTGRKRNGVAPIQVAAVVEAPTENTEDETFVVAWCACGNLVTPRAQKLQDRDPAVAKKCFNCLLHERSIGTVQRTKDGWA